MVLAVLGSEWLMAAQSMLMTWQKVSITNVKVAYFSLSIVGLPAYQADVRAGDMIVEIEGTDVTKANGDMIVSMIKWVLGSVCVTVSVYS